MDNDHLTYIWRPVPSGRHAFRADDRHRSADETVTAYCGAETLAAELHRTRDIDWIMKITCMDCWHKLETRTRGSQPAQRHRDSLGRENLKPGDAYYSSTRADTRDRTADSAHRSPHSRP